MARPKKGKNEMTRTVRIYEGDARLVEIILAGKGKGVSFADVINDAIKRAYPELVIKAEAIIDSIQDTMPDEKRK
jgi:hypothetical protein